MLQYRSSHSKSTSCLALRQQLLKQKPPSLLKRRSQTQFAPFQSERKLGKLITAQRQLPKHKPTNDELIEKINFKNFAKIYRVVMKYQNRKYSEQTRSSGQRDLINHEWKLNNLSKLPYNHQSKGQISARSIVNTQKSLPKGQEQFQKMNKYLFKKLSKVKQPSNPELHQLYSNYIRVSELNENIKRAELIGKVKPMPMT